MQPTNRKPVYAEREQSVLTRRVVSVPNGLWQAQRWVGPASTDKYDGWQSTHRPTDFETAKRQAQVMK